MTLRSRLKQTLQTQRDSGNAVTRYGVGVIYAARDFMLACRSFLTNETYRSTTLLKWFKSQRLHQTTDRKSVV